VAIDRLPSDAPSMSRCAGIAGVPRHRANAGISSFDKLYEMVSMIKVCHCEEPFGKLRINSATQQSVYQKRCDVHGGTSVAVPWMAKSDPHSLRSFAMTEVIFTKKAP